MTILREKFGLSPSSVWAIVVLILGFLGFMAFLINAGHTPEMRSMLLLIGQAFAALVNLWLIHHAASQTDKRVEHNTQITEQVKEMANEVKETLNGNTPPPGSIPPAQYQPEH
jgi:hypothetical protein